MLLDYGKFSVLNIFYILYVFFVFQVTLGDGEVVPLPIPRGDLLAHDNMEVKIGNLTLRIPQTRPQQQMSNYIVSHCCVS